MKFLLSVLANVIVFFFITLLLAVPYGVLEYCFRYIVKVLFGTNMYTQKEMEEARTSAPESRMHNAELLQAVSANKGHYFKRLEL